MTLRSSRETLPCGATVSNEQKSGNATVVRPSQGRSPFLVSLLLCLYMIGTSRWGSYFGIPGAPFFIGDALFALALGQVAVHVSRNRSSLRALAQAPLVLLLVIALAGWAVLRMATGLDTSTTALRDFAPYAYALLAISAFLLPTRSESEWRGAIYGVLGFHATWLVGLPLVPGFPWNLPDLGNDAVLFVARPDFDSAVCGVAAALALHDVLHDAKPRRLWHTTLLLAFAAVNVYAMATLETRAGFLAGVFAMAAVAVTKFIPGHDRQDGLAPRRRRWQLAVAFMAVIVSSAALLLTPTGTRIVQGIQSPSSQAHGTISVRQSVWNRVDLYVFRSAKRTAVGIGFGRNFIDESGSRNALEGETFQNVRSPHNYVVGTLARLGVAGALLAMLIIVLGWGLAVSRLRRPCGAITTLAATLCLALPVIALLGVVFESPFGALAYFWAVGQLASQPVSREPSVNSISTQSA